MIGASKLFWRLRKLCSFTIASFLVITGLNGQVNSVTDLGNLFGINDEGKLSIERPQTEDPFIKSEIINALPADYKLKLEQLVAWYDAEDFKCYKMRMDLNVDISNFNVKLQGAKRLKSKEMEKSISEGIATTKLKQAENEVNYKDLVKKYKSFLKIYNLKTEEEVKIFLDNIDRTNGVAKMDVVDSLAVSPQDVEPTPIVNQGTEKKAKPAPKKEKEKKPKQKESQLAKQDSKKQDKNKQDPKKNKNKGAVPEVVKTEDVPSKTDSSASSIIVTDSNLNTDTTRYTLELRNDDLASAKMPTEKKAAKAIATIDQRLPWEVDTSFGDNKKLIVYTPLKMKDYYKETQMLNGFAVLNKVNGKQVLDLNLVFHSSAVKSSYGVIERNGFMKIDFLRGPSIYLKSKDGSTITTEPITGNTIYKVRYEFDSKDDVSRIRKSYLDAIGIMWSSGFESYPIYDTDFFIRSKSGL
jgi:hypothetical protein